MDIIVLTIGVLAIIVGLIANHARTHDNLNVLGKWTKSATAFAILGGFLLIILSLTF